MVSGLALASLVLALLQPRSAAPHPLHTTMAEVRVEGGEVRITIRAFADDFARAVLARLEAGAGDHVPDSLAFAYVRRHFVLRAAGAPVVLAWCGMVRRGDAYRLCLTAAGVGSLRGLVVASRLHHELYDDQVNIVQAVHGRDRASVLFLRGDGPRPLLR